MLHLYDKNHSNKTPLTEYKDLKTVSVLSTGDKTLTFSLPFMLEEESYVRTKDNEFVIKSSNATNGDWFNITATLNVETLEGKEWKSFETVEATIEDALNLAFAGTGWIVISSSVTKRRTIRLTNTDSWKILQQALKTYRCEIKLDSINKTATIAERLGEDKGVYFIDSLNLISINKQSNSNDFYTRLIALGKTTVTGEGDNAIENTLEVIVENHQYSNKVKTLIWKDERYTDEASLREDATYKLEELSKPYKAYNVNVLDLANMNVKYKDILSYGLGDTVTIISNGFKDKQRIVKLTEYPEEPEKNSCELGNVTLTFEQIQKEEKEVASTVSNITSDNGTISEGAIKDVVKKIVVGTINVDELNAIKVNVGELNATVAKINTAYIDKAYIDTLIADYATIKNLEAAIAKIGILEVDYGIIEELLAGNITSENIQTGSLTGSLLNMLTVFITDANIVDVTAGKITSGTLDTSKVTIQSKNGNIVIADATQQFKDQNGNVRLQIGQDAAGNFTFVLLDETGAGVLIDSTGIKENAIGNGLIKENMIGEGEVGGTKIDWTSFVQEFNKDTNVNTINSSKIMIDGTGQTLHVAFNSLKTQSDETKEESESNTTQINTQQGKIDALIQDTTIVKDGLNLKLKDEYSKLEQTVSEINTTVGQHTTDLKDNLQVVKDMETKIQQNSDEISLRVEATEILKVDLESWARSYVNSPMIVRNVNDETYLETGYDGKAYNNMGTVLGGVFGSAIESINRVQGGIDTVSTAWGLINSVKLYRLTKKQIYLDNINLISNFFLNNKLSCDFYGSPFTAIPNSIIYNSNENNWKPFTSYIHIRIFYHCIFAMLEAYDITKNNDYKILAQDLFDGVAIFHENIKQRCNSNELAPYMWGSQYTAINTSDGATSYEPAWTEFSTTTLDMVCLSVNKYIELFGNEIRTNGEGVSYSIQSIKDEYSTHLLTMYNNYGLRKPNGHNLLYCFLKFNWEDTTDSLGRYLPKPTNWDFINDIWGEEQWFTGDLEFWAIKGFALAGYTEISKSLINRYYELRVKETDEILFYDRYNAIGEPLSDDKTISIVFTSLYMDICNYIDITDNNKICVETLRNHQVKSVEPLVDGGFKWDITDSESVLEAKTLGEIIYSSIDKLLIDVSIDKILNETTKATESIKKVNSKITQTAKDLTIEFTEVHNKGYEQGITIINKDGIKVSHNNVSSKTSMSVDGFSILDENDDVLAWLSSKKQWTELNVDKVFASNVDNIYQGLDNLYVNHNYVEESDGSSSKPFKSFNDLKIFLEATRIINTTLTINIVTSGDCTEGLILDGFCGKGTLNIKFAASGKYQGESTREAGIKLSNIKIPVFISGSALFNKFLHGALFYNCEYVNIENTIFNVPNWGCYFQNSNGRVCSVDFANSWNPICSSNSSVVYTHTTAGNGKGERFRVTSGGIIIYGTNTTTAVPNGVDVNYGGIIQKAGEVMSTNSWNYPPANPAPSTPTTGMTYTQSFSWTSHKTYQYSWSNWGDSDCKQGSWGYGLRGGHMFFDIAAIRSFLSGTVQDGNTITLTRASSGGLSGAANVYINGSTCSSASGTPGYSNQTLLGTLSWGETKTFTLPKSIVNTLKSGACSSLAVYINSTSQSNYINIVNCSITLKVNK